MRFFSRSFILSLFGTLLLISAPRSTSLSDLPPPTSAKKISIRGVHNAGMINDHLYRGSQPNLNDLSELKKLGVTTIVDLRAESPQTAEQERIRAEALGM